MQNFIKIVRAVFEVWTKNIKNAPKMGVFPICNPQVFFFQKAGSVTFVPLRCPNFMQKLEKNNERSLRYSRTDRLPTDGPQTDGPLTDGRTRVIAKDSL